MTTSVYYTDGKSLKQQPEETDTDCMYHKLLQ